MALIHSIHFSASVSFIQSFIEWIFTYLLGDQLCANARNTVVSAVSHPHGDVFELRLERCLRIIRVESGGVFGPR